MFRQAERCKKQTMYLVEIQEGFLYNLFQDR